ncbi:MAG: DUF1553 domain-containing protein [Verrucomicrobiaceae bacterium]|nr:DUF1553 domain-containing protein [Verrucomicrobiaceae bacterium]
MLHSSTPACALLLLPVLTWAAEPVSFNFQVRPILAAKCFSCHGSDEGTRKGDLRLDIREAAVEAKAIVPGAPSASSLIERLETSDKEELMPPPDKHEPLSVTEKQTLKDWITQGAPYEKHWAFIPPTKTRNVESARTAIDQIVREGWQKKGLTGAPEATKSNWLRRVTLALTGLPPKPEDVVRFEADKSPNAHENVVERLLSSPHFGEHLAVSWLDAVRYADTYGRHEDADSVVWPWRDWVIRAFNSNLPFDQFLRDQIAGDLLPNPSQDQIIATAMQRLPVQSNESGSEPEEFRWDQVFDRVNTFSSAVLGLTLECARCHDHKYDPFTMKDYYQLAAYFDKIDELGLFARYTNGVPAPTALVYGPGQRDEHLRLVSAVADAEQRLKRAREGSAERMRNWLTSNRHPGENPGLLAELTGECGPRKPALMPAPEIYVSFDRFDFGSKHLLTDGGVNVESLTGISYSKEWQGVAGRALGFPRESPRKIAFPKVAHYLRTSSFTFSIWFRAHEVPTKGVILHRSRAGLDAANRGYELTFEDKKLTATLANFYPGNAIRIQAEEEEKFKEWRHVAVTYDGSSRASGLKLYIDGRPLKTRVVRDSLYRDIDYRSDWGDLNNKQVADADSSQEITLKIGGRTLDAGLQDAEVDELRAYDRELSSAEIAMLSGASAENEDWLAWYEREVDSGVQEALSALKSAREAENQFSALLPEIMVMSEKQGYHRQTHILERGDYRQPREPVGPGTPAVFSSIPSKNGNRLDLAEWVTNPANPLASRVAVNRIWSLFFGRGLVETAEDFGVQGKVPAQPELLDWLARHFAESGWDVKALCREIALSATFRQSSVPQEKTLMEIDPSNQSFARGPRFRLTAEQLRDSALFASGLLVPKVAGPSVKPYQPAGLWEDSGTQHVYEQDHGESLYRRSLYTFWRRTCPPPVMSVFDAPTREFCRARRLTTNTPLQALALMNDTGFVECSRVLAENVLLSQSRDIERVVAAYCALTSYLPSDPQKNVLLKLLTDARRHYSKATDEAQKLLKASGESKVREQLPPQEVAAMLVVVRAIMNTDGFITSD